jgi:hypothetical protein
MTMLDFHAAQAERIARPSLGPLPNRPVNLDLLINTCNQARAKGEAMSNAKAGSMAVVFVLAAFAALPAQAQTAACPKQSATGHIEIIGSVAGVNLGRHIIYSFSAIQTGDVDADGICIVNGQIEEFLYAADPGGNLEKRGDLLRRSHGDVVCIGVGRDLSTPRPGEPPRPVVAHMAAQITDFFPPPETPPTGPVFWVWKVQDNGEGANDPPDFGSALLGVTAQRVAAFCAAGDRRDMGPGIRGNVQVRLPDLP